MRSRTELKKKWINPKGKGVTAEMRALVELEVLLDIRDLLSKMSLGVSV